MPSRSDGQCSAAVTPPGPVEAKSRERPNASVQLSAESLQRLADLIAEQLADRIASPVVTPPQLVDAAALARALGVSRTTVYAHADELGGRRVGGALRFDLAHATGPSRAPQPTSAPPARRTAGRRRTAAGSVLRVRDGRDSKS